MRQDRYSVKRKPAKCANQVHPGDALKLFEAAGLARRMLRCFPSRTKARSFSAAEPYALVRLSDHVAENVYNAYNIVLMHVDRRRVPRVLFGGVTEVSCAESSEHVIAPATQLSTFGCFIRTPAPLPKGSKLTLKITYNGKEFAAAGEVLYAEPGMGMGVGFDAISPRDRIVLDDWLAQAVPEPARIRTALLDDFPVELTCPSCKEKSWARISALKEQKAYTFPCGHSTDAELLLKTLPPRNAGWTE